MRAFEATFVVIAVLLLSGAFLPLWVQKSGGSVGSADSVPLLRNMAIAIYLVTLPLMVIRRREVAAVFRRHLPTLALLAVVLLSSLWSADPSTTFRRGVALVFTTGFGIYLAARYELPRLLQLVATALLIGGVLSAVTAVALPDYGIDVGDHAGDWRGIYSHKNSLGEIMVLSAVVHFILWRSARRRRLYLAGAIFSAMLVLLSTSKTALGVLLTLMVLSLLYRSLRWSVTVALPVLCGCVLLAGGVAVATLANSEAIFAAIGKDPTFTGRTPMWQAIIDMIEQRPLLGYGYSAFWGGWGSPSAPVLASIGWNTPHAHNGFLDILVQIGSVGLLVFIFGLITATRDGVRVLRTERSAVGLWPLLFLSFLVLYNITETTILQQNNLYWAMYAATVFSWISERSGSPQASEHRRDVEPDEESGEDHDWAEAAAIPAANPGRRLLGPAAEGAR